MVGLLLLRLGLAAVFALAAFGKLGDRAGTRAAISAFGAPARIVRPLAVVLPLAELAVAAALLVPSTARAGAIGALALLAVFSTAIVLNLARGRRPDCHCFGQVHSEPIGAATLLRNAALAAAAALVVGFGSEDAGPSAIAWAVSSPGVALAAGLVAGLAVAVWMAFTLTRRHGSALRRIDVLEGALREAGLDVPEAADPPKLPIGTPAPAFAGMDELLAAGRPLLVAFTSPGCGPCRELKPKLAGWGREHGELLKVAEVDYEDDPPLAEAYGIEGTPAAILIGPGGAVESGVAHGSPAIEELVESALLEHLPPPPDVGELLPDLALESLDAERVSLRSALATDRDTLLMFWNPSCGFCNAMRDDVRALDEGPLNGHPSLVVVSSGDPDGLREDGFNSPVLLDPMSLASSSVGAGGTPTAILVGSDGTVRSTVAGGRDAVLDLAGVLRAEVELQVVAAGAGNEGKDQG